MTTMTETILRTPVESPGAWMGRELARGEEWLVPITEEQRDEFRGFMALAKQKGLQLADIRRDTFELHALKPLAETVASEIENGLGLIVLRGLDLEGVSPEDAGLMYYAFGVALGRPVDMSGHRLSSLRSTACCDSVDDRLMFPACA